MERGWGGGCEWDSAWREVGEGGVNGIVHGERLGRGV